MTWQELKDDLDHLALLGEPSAEVAPVVVARRVLALYQPCQYCADPVTGERGNRECFRCSETEIMPSNKWPDWRGNGPTFGARELFRYLFEGDVA